MTPSISVHFPEGSAMYRGIDDYGFPVWSWLKRIPSGKLVPGTMPKAVVQRVQRQQAQVAE